MQPDRPNFRQELCPENRRAFPSTQVLFGDHIGGAGLQGLEQVCGEYPNFGPAWMLRARLTLNENRAREAREYYERGVALDPALKNDDLLKRIRQAGGQRTAEPTGGGMIARHSRAARPPLRCSSARISWELRSSSSILI